MENNGGVSGAAGANGVEDFKFGRDHVAQINSDDYDSEVSDSAVGNYDTN